MPVAADAVLIPLHCEYFALEGLADLIATMRRVRAALIPPSISKACCSRCSTNAPISASRSRTTSGILQTESVSHRHPRNIRLGEAPSHGMPILRYDRNRAARKRIWRSRAKCWSAEP